MEQQKNTAVLGIDCEGVIFYLLGGQVPGALTNLQKIVRSGHFKEIYIISRANILNRVYFRLRLSLSGFWETTGIPASHVVFCWRNKDKAAICRKLKVTDFVDNRLDVLRHLESVPRRFALAPEKNEMQKFHPLLPFIQIAESWEKLTSVLLNG